MVSTLVRNSAIAPAQVIKLLRVQEPIEDGLPAGTVIESIEPTVITSRIRLPPEKCPVQNGDEIFMGCVSVDKFLTENKSIGHI